MFLNHTGGFQGADGFRFRIFAIPRIEILLSKLGWLNGGKTHTPIRVNPTNLGQPGKTRSDPFFSRLLSFAGFFGVNPSVL